MAASPDDDADDLQFWGLPPETFGDGDEADGTGIWPQNLEAVHAFVAVGSQMRIGPGGVIGLDYTAVRAGFRLSGLKVSPDLWSDVQILEAAAVAALNRKFK